MKSLTVVLDAILQYYYSNPEKDKSDDDNVGVGKTFYDTYSNNMKIICDNVVIGNETLFSIVEPANFFYKAKKIIRVVRGKYKNGVWETGENYDSEKLYVNFKNICHDTLNII